MQRIDYLLAAQAAGLHRLLAGVLQIFRATGGKRKYFHLLAQLEQMDLLHIPGKLHEIMGRSRLQGVTSASEQVTIKAAPVTPQIVYVQPRGTGPGIINFHEFAAVVRQHDDPLSARFTQSLLEWAEVEAGSGRPGD